MWRGAPRPIYDMGRGGYFFRFPRRYRFTPFRCFPGLPPLGKNQARRPRIIPAASHGPGERQGDISSPPSTIEFSLFLGGTASYYAVLGRYASSGITIRMPLLVLMWGKGCLTIKSLAMKTAPGVKDICDPANHEQSGCTGV